MYLIVCAKEKDALNITLSNGTNFTTVHLCSQKRTFTVILRPLYYHLLRQCNLFGYRCKHMCL